MSLSVALNYAVSGLTATQAQLQVVAGNVANAQTPGYSEETLSQNSDTSTNGGAGVVTGAIQRETNVGLQAAVLNQATISSAASALGTYQTQVQNLLGQIGSGNSLGDALNSFTSAMQTAAATPADPQAQSSLVNFGQQLASKLNNLSSGVQSLRQNVDTQLGTDVTTLNTALANIAQFNGQIAKLQALSQPTATLEDQRDQALSQVAQLIGVQSYTRSDGTMVVLSDQGKTLVDATNARKFAYTPAGNVTATTTLSTLTLAGADVTAETTNGEMGALLQLRDTDLPGLTAQLNAFTKNLFASTTTSDLATTNSGLGATSDANHFFADINTSGVDNAATIAVNPSLVTTPSLLDTHSGAPDPTITANLLAGLQGTASYAAAGGIPATTTSLSSYVSQIIGTAATTSAAATSTASDQSALLTQMQNQYSSSVGVNIDAELSKLIQYQNAYSASARVITTIQSMFQALMQA
jgi:flagellar hook-associated protein 1